MSTSTVTKQPFHTINMHITATGPQNRDAGLSRMLLNYRDLNPCVCFAQELTRWQNNKQVSRSC